MNVFPLPTRAVLLVSGADRAAFLQGQLTQDVGLLKGDTTLTGALLSPPGRVLAVAHLIERDGAIALIVAAEIADALAGRLRRYVLRAKVTIALPGDALRVAAVLGGAPGAAHRRLEDGASLVELGARALLLAPPEVLAAHLTRDAAPDTASAWELAAIRAGMPAVFAPSSEHWTAQMLNLDLVAAISFSKGCYTGQEIVARTQHLGRIKRRMFRYRAPDRTLPLPAPGDALALGAAKVGEVVRAAVAPEGTELLAVVGLEARDHALRSARGIEFAPAPLPYAIV